MDEPTVLEPTVLSSAHGAAGEASRLEGLARGSRVDRYIIEEVLGEGGMGIVYRAIDPELGRPIALKLVRSAGFANTPGGMGQARLLREAKAMARLAHPNVVAVFDVGVTGNQVFVAMELVDGVSLRTWLRERRHSWREVLSVMQQAGRGLEAAHAAGLVHRDFKPENVLLGRDGRVRVLDLGLARSAAALARQTPVTAPSPHLPTDVTPALGDTDASERVGIDSSLTSTGAVLGTPRYMAPEQHRGTATDARTDQFSFCVTVYEALYGEPPFAGENRVQLMRTVQAGDVSEPPGDARVPRWLRRVVLRGLVVVPEGRFPSMAALLGALDQGARRTWRIWILVASAVLLVIAAVVATIVMVPRGEPTPPPERPTELASPAILPTAVHRQVTFTGDATMPRLSPDGLYLAYLSGRSPKQRLIVQELATGRAQVLSWWNLVVDMRWAPAGDKLLVMTGRGLYTMPRDGGERSLVAHRAQFAAWSRDGGAFVTAAWDPAEIRVYDVATPRRQVFRTNLKSVWLLGVDWSPEHGRFLLLTRESVGFALWTLDAGGLGLRQVFHDTRSVHAANPRWLRDGETITYERHRDLASEIVALRLDAAGSEPVPMLAGPIGAQYSSSRDARRLAYTQIHLERNIVRVTAGEQGEAPVWLTTGTQLRRGAAPSPDGTSVAFAMGAVASAAHIFVMPLAGGVPRQITDQAATILGLAWSPDGRTIAYTVAVDGGGVEVWRVDVASGAAERLVDGASETGDLAWAPAGAILYQVAGNQNYEALDPDSGAHQPLVADDPAGWMFNAKVSPDGTRVAVNWNREDGGLWTISLVNGAQTRISATGKAPVGWSDDAATIFVTDHRSVVAVSLEHGVDRPLALPPGLELRPPFNLVEDGSLAHIPGTPASFVGVDYRGQSDVWLTGDFPGDAVATVSGPALDPPGARLPPGYPATVNSRPVNLEFEDGEADGLPVGWHLSEETRQIAKVTVSAEGAAQGRAAARLAGDGSVEPELKQHFTAAGLMQCVDAAPYRGAHIRLRAALRVEGTSSSAGIWLNFERAGGSAAAPADTDWQSLPPDRRVTGPGWTTRQLDMHVPVEADLLAFGVDLIGDGTAWVDAVHLDVVKPAPPGARAGGR